LSSIRVNELLRGGGRAVVFFCMPETGHFQRLLPLISGLSRGGVAAHVFTHHNFRAQVENAGGLFFDLFAKYPLEQADDESIPISSRFVTFAATYAERVRRDIEKIKPSLIIHDTFAVIGPVMATLLDLPRVNVCAGHNVVPARYLAALPQDPRVKISSRCLEAVKILRESYGLKDASPFSYVSSISPLLNIYCEPPEFLDEAERLPFEPIAFYGSLPEIEEENASAPRSRGHFAPGSNRIFKLYISFGTIIWRYYTEEALRALNTLAETFADVDNVRAVISLGRANIETQTVAALTRPNVSVESYVDQWRILEDADAFLTHQGLNSTHEAIFHLVPMISYPFFWDQPELADKCRKFGLAVPLTESPRDEFGKGQVLAALKRLADNGESMRAALTKAREWEKAVIHRRPEVHRRIVELIE
jgi:MGT family glycosyltransferase